MRRAAIAILVLLVCRPAAAQLAAPRGWAISYANGRTSTQFLRAKGEFWTPRFPTIGGADTTQNALPLHALDVSWVEEGSDVVATVTLIYGAFQHRVVVDTVRVTPLKPQSVDALRAYGVEPITLSIVPLEMAVAIPLAV